MIEKRNRNGGREAPDEDTDAQPDEATALKETEAPARKPSTEPAPPAEKASRPKGGGGGTRVVLLLVVIAAAALGYRYWGFWQGEQLSLIHI